MVMGREFIFLDKEPLVTKIPMRSLLYGEGVFETFRWRGTEPVFLKKHLDRMKNGAKLLSIPMPAKKIIKNSVKEAVDRSNIMDAIVKICLLSSGSMIFHGDADKAHLMVIVKNYEKQKGQMRAHIASFRRNSSPLLCIKSTNYLENVTARREAKNMGYDECIFLNQQDEITEGSSTNIFWIKGEVMYTPSVDCGLLPGITRETIITLGRKLGLEVKEGRFKLEDLLSSNCAFLTNSLIGMAALTQIDSNKINFNEEIYVRIRDALFRKLRWTP
ncbi:MAG TPA: aminodeoxychorismate lyase [Hadesarchaea archaeon]|nr:aminodeoxychorismate lyase [Hadesarchaea archaeon]